MSILYGAKQLLNISTLDLKKIMLNLIKKIREVFLCNCKCILLARGLTELSLMGSRLLTLFDFLSRDIHHVSASLRYHLNTAPNQQYYQ